MTHRGAEGPSGPAIIAALRNADIEFVAAVPDIVTSDGLLWPLSCEHSPRLIRICKEDEGISICAAMSLAETRAILLMQQTGLMDSLNALRAMGMDYRLPVCMMVGLQGKEPDVPMEHSASYGVRIIGPVLDAMGVRYSMLNGPSDVDSIGVHITAAYAESRPHCFLFGRSPVP